MIRQLFLLACAAVCLAGCQAKRELHLATWADDIAPEVVAAFEKHDNCRIVVDTFDTNEAMYAKLRAGAA